MNYVLIIHKVTDYHQWKSIFDRAVKIRKEAGEIRYQLLKYEHNAQHIVHFSEWGSLAAAKVFFESEALTKIRKEAGVMAPKFMYLHQIEEMIL